jgi:hypothetical protein
MGEKSSQILSTAGVKVLSNAVTAHCGTELKLFLRKSSPLGVGALVLFKERTRGDSYGND